MQNRILKLSLFTMLLTLLTGCELVGDIFQAGMVTMLIIIAVVVVLIIWLISKFRK